MPAIPSIESFTGAPVTEGEFKTALSNLHLFLTGLLGTDGTQAGGQAAMGAILGAGSTTKTAAYTVAIADRGKVIACSGTFTVTLLAAATAGDGFAVAIANYGTGTITVDPNSSETIDGATTKALGANSMLVACSVAGEWLTVGGMKLPTASTSAAGVVQLSGSVGSDSNILAATPSAVKAAYDLAASRASKDVGVIDIGGIAVLYGTGDRVAGAPYTSPGNYVNFSGGGISISSVAAGTWRFLGGVGAVPYGLYQRIS